MSVERSEIVVNGETKNVALIFAEVDKLLEGKPVSRAWRNDVLVCIDEAFSNIIRHGYLYAPEGKVLVTMTLYRDYFRIIFQDTAAEYKEPRRKPALGRAILKRKTPGLGWHLMRQLMDRVAYQRIGESNCLVLTKKIGSEDRNDSEDKRAE